MPHCWKSHATDQLFILYFFQTNAFFDVSGGEMTLKSLERKCDLRHARCNSACTEETTECWQCCRDNDKCNSFPLRGNVVVTSSASTKVLKLFSTIVFFTSSYLITLLTWTVNQLSIFNRILLGTLQLHKTGVVRFYVLWCIPFAFILWVKSCEYFMERSRIMVYYFTTHLQEEEIKIDLKLDFC